MYTVWLLTMTTVTLAAVMAAAVWRPSPGQWVLLLVGPVLSVASSASGVSGGLGLTAVSLVPYLYLLVSPALPWQRPWARRVVPGTVLFWCVVLLVLGRSGLTPLTVAAAVLAVVALVRDAARRQASGAGDARSARADDPRAGALDVEPRWAPVARRVVVGVAVLQGLAGVLCGVGGLLLYGYERRYPSTDTWSGLGEAIALAVAVLGCVVGALFVALAVGLRRRYGDVRFVLVVVQLLLAALPLLYRQSSWVLLSAWGVATAVLALVTPAAPWAESSDAPDPSGPARVTGPSDASPTR